MKRISFDKLDTSAAYLKCYEISNDNLIIPYFNVAFPNYTAYLDDSENEIIDYCRVVCVDIVVVKHNGKEIYLSDQSTEGMVKLVRLTGTHVETKQREEFLVFCRRCYLEINEESDFEEDYGLVGAGFPSDIQHYQA